MKTTSQKPSRFMRIISAPIRVLCKARDLYVRALSECADGAYGNMVCPGVQYPAFPRSFSSNSSMSNDDDDLRELIRAASARSFGDRVDVEAVLRKNNSSKSTRKPSLGSRVLPKSSSVRMERIDEDSPYNFSLDGSDTTKVEVMYPRSRTCTVMSRRADIEARWNVLPIN